MDIVEVNRWFLAVFFAVVATFYVVRITFLGKKTQEIITPTGPPGSLHFRIHMVFRLFRALILLLCWLRLWWPKADSYIGIIPALWSPAVLVAGDILMVSAMAGIVGINLFLSDRWRSGIPDHGPAELVTDGPYRLSRNPMMVLVMVAQTGFFLALPSLFSLTCLAVGLASIVMQATLEEQALTARFGDQYSQYKARTPRWIPGR